MMGGIDGYTSYHGVVSLGARRYYSKDLVQRLGSHVAYEDYDFDVDRISRWHPLNRMVYANYKIHLAGLLLNHKGDRVAMANSVETRYPFLDEDVIRLLARVHPRWKLKGLSQNKYILRRAAERYLPSEIAWRPKHMFRAPFAASLFDTPADFVRDLMSPAALRETGYFDVAQFAKLSKPTRTARRAKWRFFAGIGLVGVLATQLWHHLHIGGGLCELPRAAHELRAKDRSWPPADRAVLLGGS